MGESDAYPCLHVMCLSGPKKGKALLLSLQKSEQTAVISLNNIYQANPEHFMQVEVSCNMFFTQQKRSPDPPCFRTCTWHLAQKDKARDQPWCMVPDVMVQTVKSCAGFISLPCQHTSLPKTMGAECMFCGLEECLHLCKQSRRKSQSAPRNHTRLSFIDPKHRKTKGFKSPKMSQASNANSDTAPPSGMCRTHFVAWRVDFPMAR